MQKLMLQDTQLIMPTAAKLFGALGLALTGYFAARLIPGHLPAGTEVEGLTRMSSALGLLIGWRVMGARPGQGFAAALQRALHAVIYLVLMAMLFLGTLQMMRQMARGRYGGPMEALTDVLAQGVSLGEKTLQLDVLAVLFCGATVSAIVAEWAWKRWH